MDKEVAQEETCMSYAVVSANAIVFVKCWPILASKVNGLVVERRDSNRTIHGWTGPQFRILTVTCRVE